ncbi:MAG: GNAT family N-acetyltransferase [Phycisphaerae bacterium]
MLEEEAGRRLRQLREEVFVGEQGVAPDIEFDALDPKAIHWVALEGDAVVATLRVLREATRAKIGRVAVRRDRRGTGIGRQIMLAAMAACRQEGVRIVQLHSQVQVRGFYEKLGFHAVGDEFTEAGIRHVTMERRLPDRS